MIDVPIDNVVDLHRVIKDYKNGNREDKIKAAYILDELAKHITSILGIIITRNELCNAIIQVSKKTNSKEKDIDKKTIKIKTVGKYYIVVPSKKDCLIIISQVIENRRKGLETEQIRKIFVLEEPELMGEEKAKKVYLPNGGLNFKNYYVKKLLPKPKKSKKIEVKNKNKKA